MKKLLPLFVAMLVSSSALAQEKEWGANVLPNSDLEGDVFTHVAVKPNKIGDAANSAVFTGDSINVERGLAPGKGVGGSQAISVFSAAGASQDWDAQFWICIPDTLEASESFHVKFDYRADWDETIVDGNDDPIKSIEIGTQAHGAPGAYHHWEGVGSAEFTGEWQTFEADVTISSSQYGSDGAGFTSIAFNLCQNNKDFDATFYFDNIELMYEKVDETMVTWWKPLISNGTFEGDDTKNYVVRISGKGDENPTPEEGVGTDESRGIKMVVPAKVSQPWDSQFFISFNEPVAVGDILKVTLDYKASETVGTNIDTQAHGTSPGSYNHYSCAGSLSFTEEWKHLESLVSVDSNMSKDDNPFQNIAFNMAVADHEVTYYLDNITVKLKKLVPASENPEKMELENYLESLESTYDFNNIGAWVANKEIRDAFVDAVNEAKDAEGDDVDYGEIREGVIAAEGRFTASVKDYTNLQNYINYIAEKAAQADEMSAENEPYGDLRDELEAYSEPLLEAYTAEEWTKAEIVAAVDHDAVMDKVKASVAANLKAGDDVTILLDNTAFNWGNSYWNGNKPTVSYQVGEFYHAKADMNQTITDMPQGLYEISIQGFQRLDNDVEVRNAVFYADNASKYLDNRDEVETELEEAPNSMAAASDAFAQGYYVNTLNAILAEAGDLKIGVKITDSNYWVIFDNLKVVYKGADAATYAAALQDQIDRAKEVKTALEETLNAPTIEDAEEAIYQAELLVDDIASATQEKCDAAVESLNKAVADMEAASVLVNKVLGDFVTFQDSYALYAGDEYTCTEAIKNRADKANAAYDSMLDMTNDELNAYSAELLYLAEAMKVCDATGASDAEPVDMTYLFVDPDFEDYADVGANKNYPGWSGSGFGTGGGTAGPVAERWNQTNGFNTYVEFSGLPKGAYRLTCDGAIRSGAGLAYDYAIAKGDTVQFQPAYLYAQVNGTEVASKLVHSIGEGAITKDQAAELDIDVSSDCGNCTVDSVTYYFPDQLATANTWINRGFYKDNTIEFVVAEDGDNVVRLGINRPTGLSNNWAFFDNFVLTYFGTDSEVSVQGVEVAKAAKGIYTITGVRVSNANRSGLYIINGKKVLVK